MEGVFLTDFLGNEEHLSEYLSEHLLPYQHDLLLSIKYAAFVYEAADLGSVI